MSEEIVGFHPKSVAQNTSTDGSASALPARIAELEHAITKAGDADSWEYDLVFVNSDSGHRRIGTVEVNAEHKVVYLYEITNG
jgi:hypothetical protein